MKTLSEIKTDYNLLLRQKSKYKKTLKELKSSIKQEKENTKNLLLARDIISAEAEQAQANFKFRINSLVTMVIRSVFAQRDLEFMLTMERKANRLEAKPIIMEGKEEYDDPKRDVGGSLIDLISFALRIVLWSMQKPKTRPVFILDEPFKQIGKGQMLYRTGAMLREISRKLGLQLIIITHEPQLQEIADRAFLVELRDGKTIVQQQIGDQTEGTNKKESKEQIPKIRRKSSKA